MQNSVQLLRKTYIVFAHDVRVYAQRAVLGPDLTSALILKALIQSLRDRGRAFFFARTFLKWSKRCSQLVISRKGRMIAHGVTSEVLRQIGQMVIVTTQPTPGKACRWNVLCTRQTVSGSPPHRKSAATRLVLCRFWPEHCSARLARQNPKSGHLSR